MIPSQFFDSSRRVSGASEFDKSRDDQSCEIMINENNNGGLDHMQEN